MKKTITLILINCIIISKSAFSQNRLSAIQEYVELQVRLNHFSGVILVANKEKIIYHKAFGYADREWNISNTLESKFEIASLTKQFTAAAILKLEEQHKLSLTDKLSKYFPNYPYGDQVTLHMLLSHTSGIADYGASSKLSDLHRVALPKDSIIALLKTHPYQFTPGTKWSYSNYGYFLLGYIVEKVSKQSYEDYLNKYIIKNISLQNTSFNRIDSVLAFRVKGYSSSEKDGWKNAEFISMEIVYSAGALISTAKDLYSWQNALLDGKVVSKESLTKMTTSYLHNYGYGLGIDTFKNHRRIFHQGEIPGFTSFLGNFPNDKLSVVVLSNEGDDVTSMANALSSIMLGLPFEVPGKKRATGMGVH